jgi:nitroreductase
MLTNETIGSIHRRRSVRLFSDKPIPPDDITILLKAANQAPSAHNQQSWRFMVLREARKKTGLADLITQKAADFPRPSSTLLRMAARSIVSAPVVIGVANTGELIRRGDELFQVDTDRAHDFFRTMEIQSSAAAVQNLLLAATSLVKKEVLAYFGEEDGEFMAVIALGYPARPTPGPKKRPLEAVVRYLR